MNLAKIKGFKIVTTVMDCIVAIVMVFGAAVSCIFLGFFSIGVDWLSDALNNVDTDSLTAGYEVIAEVFGFVGGLLLVGVALASVVVCLIMAVIAVISSVSGFVLLARYKKLLNGNPKKYKRGVITDSIIKLTANGLPTLFLIYDMIGSKSISAFEIIPLIYLGIICLFEILVLIWNRSLDL